MIDENMKKTGQVLRIAKFERFAKLDNFEKIWKDLKKLMIRDWKHWLAI